jgi:hypothetical protein
MRSIKLCPMDGCSLICINARIACRRIARRLRRALSASGKEPTLVPSAKAMLAAAS